MTPPHRKNNRIERLLFRARVNDSKHAQSTQFFYIFFYVSSLRER